MTLEEFRDLGVDDVIQSKQHGTMTVSACFIGGVTTKGGVFWYERDHAELFLIRKAGLESEAVQAAATLSYSLASILVRANEIINGDRARDYGKACENMARIAERWSQVFGVPVTIEQVCLAMIDLKVARLLTTPDHEDSWLDIAGYVGVMDKARRGE